MDLRKALMRACLSLAIAAGAVIPLRAQVETDGTMGPVTELSGTMIIGSDLGTLFGANLFHSFSVFNIQPWESATFTSSLPGPIQNVIGRVTGSELSTIDGLLACDIQGANLYLINPNGIAFGKNASVDVKGSFSASTADYLAFEDGKQFKAKPDSIADATLSVASPAAFGFLDTPAPITVNESVLNSSLFSLVGGDITVSGAKISSDMGQIHLVSVASAGEAVLSSDGAMDVTSFSALGAVSLKNGSQLGVMGAQGIGGGVYIRGGRFFMDASTIDSLAPMKGLEPIDISVTGDVTITGGSQIISEAYGKGRGADILLHAGGDIDVSSGSKVISTVSGWEGGGGDIHITAGGNLVITDSSEVTAETVWDVARGGDITINIGGDLTVTKSSWIRTDSFAATGIFEGGADSGNIDITARNVRLSDSGRIFTSSFLSAPGRAGNISIKAADTISISAAPDDLVTGISSNPDEIDWNIEDPSAGGVGGAGNIKLEAKTLSLNGGFVSTRNNSDAATGSITLSLSSLELDGGALITASTTGGLGGGGALTIQALESISLAGGSRLESGSKSAGDGGSITISTDALTVEDSFIDSSASGWGDAGDIAITANSLRLTNSAVQTSAVASAGGNIQIDVDDMFLLRDSAVSASANSVTPEDNGGNLTIGRPQFFILNLSDVLARANAGNGGNINLAADYFLRSGDSVISASSESGIDGQILIDSPNDVTGTITVLEMPSLDVSTLLQESCAAAALQQRSSFTVEGRGSLPSRPGGYLTSPLLGAEKADGDEAPARKREARP